MAWDYSFLDDGERANRRSRTVTANRGMAEDAFRNEDLSSMLTASAVTEVIAQLNGRGTSRPRTPDEWYELVRNHGAIDRLDLMAHAPMRMKLRPAGEEQIANLEHGRRLCRIRPSWQFAEALIAAEDLGCSLRPIPR